MAQVLFNRIKDFLTGTFSLTEAVTSAYRTVSVPEGVSESNWLQIIP